MRADPGRIARLEATIREHAVLVNGALASYLPATGGTFAKSLAEYLAFSEKRLRPSLAVYEPMRHVVEAGGKRIRPTLCMLACEAVGGKREMALPTAAGIEFLHTFTLVHDDIMDKDLVRRGRETVGALWGDEVAITVGDGLFALAFKAVAANADVPGVPPGRVFRVMEGAAETSLLLAQGQTMDLLMAHRADVPIDEYLEMIRLKTGVLLEFSLAAGATLGGGTKEDAEAIARFGAPLGMAFQIKDDVLDLVADEKRLGKPVGSDIRSGKRTLMVVHAMAESPDAGRLAEILEKPAAKTTDAEVREGIRILERAGSIRFAEETAERFLSESKNALAKLPATPGGEALEALATVADYIMHRDR
ncbi:MAG TPA: polyprenyl synthetase family protein [Candidatus Thermoplasmatota archaeon]|nr:polyprenyl synthetase family protein [Candidatus Thermoplasmatota archaeon]